MRTLVYSTHIQRPNKLRSLINLIGIPLLLILIILLHHLPFASLEITPRMKDGNRTPTEAHLSQTVSRRPCFYPPLHTPGRPSSTRLRIPLRVCPLTLVSSFQSISTPFRQQAAFSVALSQWSEQRREALRIPPPLHTHATPRHPTTLRLKRGEAAQMQNNYES